VKICLIQNTFFGRIDDQPSVEKKKKS